MMENWRVLLYYPLGILPSIFFFLRFFIQWIESEKKKKSSLDKNFWLLSILGNTLAAVHYFIQLQYWFLIIQIGNFAIAYRNIELMDKNRKPYSLKIVIIAFLMLLVLVSGLFFLQKSCFFNDLDLFTTPLAKFQNGEIYHVALGWQILGMIGSSLFASRFWYQWWKAEKNQKSQLDSFFWKLSISGNLLVLLYVIIIQDTVSIINYSFGIIPYARNLILLHRHTHTSISTPVMTTSADIT